ncbi:MAG TPA: hypothetical protein VN214_03925, partial [Pseudomonas sp.]|nr:hypothetical protein [Pseudomonas sp.]
PSKDGAFFVLRRCKRENFPQFMALGLLQKRQLACRECPSHAFCTNRRNLRFYKLMIYKEFFVVSNLAQRSQYLW